MWIAATLLSACAAVLAGFCVYYSRRCALAAHASQPIALRKVCEALSDRVLAAESSLSVHDSNMTLWRAEMTALAEAVDTNLDRIERKRRSAAGSASKMEAMTAGDPNTIEAITTRARAAGLM
jgi:hypothetical protein